MPALQQPSFKYKQLQDANSDIRLLELQPNRKDGLLQFRLFETELSSTPRFIALSYEWGSPADVKDILVDGIKFMVQQNLHAFLVQVHARYRSDLPINIWVDAVCINQTLANNWHGEKNRQVRIMGQIYSRAEIVLAWLGVVHEIDLTKTFLELGLKTVSLDLYAGKDADLSRTDMRPFFELTDTLTSMEWSCTIDMVWHYLEPLTIHSYWSRLWILQELVLARDFALLCESSSVGDSTGLCLTKDEINLAFLLTAGLVLKDTKDTLMATIHHQEQRSSPVSGERTDAQDHDSKPSMSSVVLFCTIGWSIWHDHRLKVPLEILIMLHAKRECHDFHDRVYGLLGMANDVTEQAIFPIDYVCQPLDLLADTILFCKSDEPFSLGLNLMYVLGIRPALKEQAVSMASCRGWELDLRSQIGPCSLVNLSQSVTAHVDGPYRDDEGPLVRFDIKSQEDSRAYDVPLTCASIDGTFVLAEVKDNLHPSVMECDNFSVVPALSQAVLSLRRSEKEDPEWWLMDLSLECFLHILTTMTVLQMQSDEKLKAWKSEHKTGIKQESEMLR